MLMLHGTILNIYETPTGTNRETGETYGGQHRVQLMTDTILRNGEERRELVDLNVRDVRPFHELRGEAVAVPVGVFANGSTVRYFHLAAAETPVVPAT